MLMALAAKSLVQRVDAGRYTLHELVRQYAQERLADSPAWTAVRERHLAYVAGLAETARDELYGAEQRQWLERLELEHDNMRVALEWAFGGGGADQAQRAEMGLRLAAGIPRFWNGRGHLREGVGGWSAGWLPGLTCAPAVRAEALSTLGWLVNMLGDTPRAKQLQLESLALCRACGDERGMAEALDALGDSAWFDGALDEAKAYYTEGLALRRRLGNPSAIGLALYSLGRLEVDHGSVEEAQPLLEEALEHSAACRRPTRGGAGTQRTGAGGLAARRTCVGRSPHPGGPGDICRPGQPHRHPRMPGGAGDRRRGLRARGAGSAAAGGGIGHAQRDGRPVLRRRTGHRPPAAAHERGSRVEGRAGRGQSDQPGAGSGVWRCLCLNLDSWD